MEDRATMLSQQGEGISSQDLRRRGQPSSSAPAGSPREQGDGAPVVSSVTSLASQQQQHSFEGQSQSTRNADNAGTKPFTVKTEIDLVQLLLTVVALASRAWRLSLPRAVVFDEVHFGRFVSLYLRRVFFFDVHPPLGKLLLAAAGSYSGYEGDATFERIGAEFPANVPVENMRAVPAVLGSLVMPLAYQICVEAGLSRYAAAVGGILLVLDNALLVQSRFMLMEGMLIFFSALSLLAYLKFRNCGRTFSTRWWFWLCLCGVAATCTLSVKYVGLFTLVVLTVRLWRDYWHMLDDSSLSEMSLLQHFICRFIAMVMLPVLVYIGLFYIHLSLLYKAGPHDNVMTSAFQASLEGGLATLTKGQPLHVAYGSQVTLRHTENINSGQPCWLHSHNHMYPVRYPDQRGSSHQQQVTCYLFKDINNWWIIKHPDRPDLNVEDPPTPVKHGDIIQLIHGTSSRALNSHDVAAPLTPNNQEVSCYVDYNVSMPAQNLWRVEILNRDKDDASWETIKSQIRLVHVNTTAALKTTSKPLPEWGFSQLEVSADRQVNQKATVWNVEEHRYTRSTEKDKQAAELRDAELIPLKPTYMSFWAKFMELQWKMFQSTSDVQLEHKFSSGPWDWPLMRRNVAYWMSPADNSQIHLVANIAVWYAAGLSVPLYLALWLFYLLRRQRAVFDISEAQWQHFCFLGELFVAGYFLHYLPFFMEDRTMFLHHYLPAVLFKVLTLVALGDHVYTLLARGTVWSSVLQYITVALLACAVHVCLSLAPFTYGHRALTQTQLDQAKWLETWDYLSHNK